jgi:glutathione S-transferase
MKLLASSTSPYVRKVRIVALEKGLDQRITLVSASPWPEPTAIVDTNPLGKVPALITEDGLHLYDSRVICEYLDSLSPLNPLIPHGGPARWQCLRTQALADGILDAAVMVVLERRRPSSQQSAATEQRALNAIRRSLVALAEELKPTHSTFDLSQICIAVVLGYLEFRFSDVDVGMSNPTIHTWWQARREHPSLLATIPIV